jgi:hypothetical protein
MRQKQVTYPIEDRWSYLWLVIGALMTLFGTGQWTIPLMTWLGAVFTIRFVRTQKVFRGYILVWLATYVTVSIAWWNILGYGAPLAFFLISMAISTLLIGALPYLADNGLSIVADPYGRTLAAVDHYSASERVMVAQVPTKGVFTLYSVIGDLFGWLAVVGSVGLAIWAVVRGRKPRGAESP